MQRHDRIKERKVMTMAIVKITQRNFDAEVANSEKPVLVDFWASWCGPCMMQSPIIDEIASEYDSIKVGKLNVDEEQALAVRFGISSIPTMIYFKDGQAAKTLVGLRSKEQLVQELGL